MLLIPTLLCPKAWEGMSGNEATRFCTYCQKHVHNLEALSATERLALLSSPAGSICSRYQVAIRRPAKGKEADYYLHLAKHGAGVALVGSVLLVLWEMHGQEEQRRYYRAVGNHQGAVRPSDFFREYRTRLLGDVDIHRPPQANPASTSTTPAHIDLDPKLIDPLLPPDENEKAGGEAGLRKGN